MFRSTRYSASYDFVADAVALSQEYGFALQDATKVLQSDIVKEVGADFIDETSRRKRLLVVCIVTAPRLSGHRYLTALIGSLLKYTSRKWLRRMKLILITPENDVLTEVEVRIV